MRNQVLAVFSALLLARLRGRPDYRRPEVATSDQFVGVEGAKFSSRRRARFANGSGDTQLNEIIERSRRQSRHPHRDRAVARGSCIARRRRAGSRADGASVSRLHRRGRSSDRQLAPLRYRSQPGLLRFRLRCLLGAGFLRSRPSPSRSEFGRSAVRRSQVCATQVSVTAEVARNYFELRGAQQRLAVAQRNAENQGDGTHHDCSIGCGSWHAARRLARAGATFGDSGDDSGSRSRSHAQHAATRRADRPIAGSAVAATFRGERCPTAGMPTTSARRSSCCVDVPISGRRARPRRGDCGDRCGGRRSVPPHHVPRPLGLQCRQEQRPG